MTLHPSRTWGGTGALGCILGYGALHRIPRSLDEPPQAPGETLFETARLSTDTLRPISRASAQDTVPFEQPTSDAPQYIIPAEMKLPPPPAMIPATSPDSKPPPLTPGVRKARLKRNNTAAVDMDDYFREGEAKSKEQDHAPSPKPREAVAPPPPKAAAVGDSDAASPPTVDTLAPEGESSAE